jgi:asparagine synthase (glutamine-hydrolysing)
MRGLLPDDILTRKKMGFPVPFAQWTRGRWHASVRDVLLDRRTCERGLINPAAVRRLLDNHRDGRIAGGDAIWALLNLELWFRTFIDGDGVQSLSDATTPATAGEGRPAPALAETFAHAESAAADISRPAA